MKPHCHWFNDDNGLCIKLGDKAPCGFAIDGFIFEMKPKSYFECGNYDVGDA